jgi:hypothetical protein
MYPLCVTSSEELKLGLPNEVTVCGDESAHSQVTVAGASPASMMPNAPLEVFHWIIIGPTLGDAVGFVVDDGAIVGEIVGGNDGAEVVGGTGAAVGVTVGICVVQLAHSTRMVPFIDACTAQS